MSARDNLLHSRTVIHSLPSEVSLCFLVRIRQEEAWPSSDRGWSAPGLATRRHTWDTRAGPTRCMSYCWQGGWSVISQPRLATRRHTWRGHRTPDCGLTMPLGGHPEPPTIMWRTSRMLSSVLSQTMSPVGSANASKPKVISFDTPARAGHGGWADALTGCHSTQHPLTQKTSAEDTPRGNDVSTGSAIPGTPFAEPRHASGDLQGHGGWADALHAMLLARRHPHPRCYWQLQLSFHPHRETGGQTLQAFSDLVSPARTSPGWRRVKILSSKAVLSLKPQ